MLLMIPLNSSLASWSKKLQMKQMGHKDSRIKLINEVLNGIKVCAGIEVASTNFEVLSCVQLHDNSIKKRMYFKLILKMKYCI